LLFRVLHIGDTMVVLDPVGFQKSAAYAEQRLYALVRTR